MVVCRGTNSEVTTLLQTLAANCVIRLVRCDSPLCHWVNYWFVRNDAWQALFAGIMAGVAVHAVVAGVWLVARRTRPNLGLAYLLAKGGTFLLIPYAIMPWYSLLTFGGENPFYHRTLASAVVFIGLNLLIRLVFLLFREKRRDWLVYEIVAVVVELYSMTYVYDWLLTDVYYYTM